MIRLTGWLAVLPMLAFYAWSDQRDVQFWDVGEMQTVPWIYGIAHPTGFPLYTALGWAFAHALPFESIAWRLSFFSSVAMCAAGWFVYRIVFEETGFAWIGVAASLAFDASAVVWSRGTRADVHPLAIAFEAAAFYATLRWRRSSEARALITAGALLGCALAVHPVAVFTLPALAALVISAAKRTPVRTLAASGAALLVPLFSYAAIPLRGAMLFAERRDPTLAIGMPPGRPFWDYAHTQVPANFWWFVSGAQFHREAGASGYTDMHVLAQALRTGGALVMHDFGLPLVVIAALGVIFTSVRKSHVAVALVLMALAAVPFAFAYTEEADKARYALATLFSVACLAGIGSAELATIAARRTPRIAKFASVALALFVAVTAGRHVYERRNVIEVNRDGLARLYVEQVRALTPRDAIVIADWTYATPLAYASYAERSLGRRIVVAGTVDDMRGYLPAWMRERCVVYATGTKAENALQRSLGARPINAALPYLFALNDCAARPGRRAVLPAPSRARSL